MSFQPGSLLLIDSCLRLIVLLKNDFNCCNCFALSLVDKVTTGTESFLSVIVNFAALVGEEIIQSADEVKMRLISQLIKDISRITYVLQWYCYFNIFCISRGRGFSCYFNLRYK